MKARLCFFFLVLAFTFSSLGEGHNLLHEVGRLASNKPTVQHNVRKPSAIKATFELKASKVPAIFKVRNTKLTKKAYKRLRDYPFTTQPLSGNITSDPIQLKYSSQQFDTMGEREASIRVSVDKTVYSLGETIRLEVKTFYRGLSHAGNINVLNLQNILVSNRTERVGSVIFEIPSEDLTVGESLLTVNAIIENETISTVLGVKVQEEFVEWKSTDPGAVSSSGDLIFNNKLDFFDRGNFIVKGILYDPNGRLIGKAYTHVRDTTGLKEVTLNFYGKLLFDKKLDGPYILKSLEVSKVKDDLSISQASFFQPNQATPQFSYDQFRRDPFQSETISKKIGWLK